MVEAWIQLRCPSCDQSWEASPTGLPEADAELRCDACGEARTTAQFMQAKRDLEILQQFAD